jgi:hypothetical protein
VPLLGSISQLNCRGFTWLFRAVPAIEACDSNSDNGYFNDRTPFRRAMLKRTIWRFSDQD